MSRVAQELKKRGYKKIYVCNYALHDIQLLRIANQIQKLQQQLNQLNNKLIGLEKQNQEYINKFEQEQNIQEKRKIMWQHNSFRENKLNIVISTIKNLEDKIQQIKSKKQFMDNILQSSIGEKIQITYNPSFDQDMSAAIIINNELITDQLFRSERVRLSHNQLRDKYLEKNHLINISIDARIIFNDIMAIILSNQSNIDNQQLVQIIKQKINNNLLIFEQDNSVKELTRLAKKKMNIILNYLGV